MNDQWNPGLTDEENTQIDHWNKINREARRPRGADTYGRREYMRTGESLLLNVGDDIIAFLDVWQEFRYGERLAHIHSIDRENAKVIVHFSRKFLRTEVDESDEWLITYECTDDMNGNFTRTEVKREPFKPKEEARRIAGG